jgi:hypothetical protein
MAMSNTSRASMIVMATTRTAPRGLSDASSLEIENTYGASILKYIFILKSFVENMFKYNKYFELISKNVCILPGTAGT